MKTLALGVVGLCLLFRGSGCAQADARFLLQPIVDEAVPDNASEEQTATWRNMAGRTIEDQKRIYLGFPGEVIHGKHLLPVLTFLGATAAMIGTDQFESPYFRRTTAYHGFNRALSSNNTTVAIVAAPAVLYVWGFAEHNAYAQSTALLMGEALVDSEVLAELLKLSTQRARPNAIALHGNFADTWGDTQSVGSGSFPSGHTIAAFSVATVMAERYGKRHRWVPYVAYLSAAAVGFSRLTLSDHHVSDVAVGAGLGFVISRFAVLGN